MSTDEPIAQECQTVLTEVQKACHEAQRKCQKLVAAARKAHKVAVTDGTRELCTLFIGAATTISAEHARLGKEAGEVHKGITERVAELKAEAN